MNNKKLKNIFDIRDGTHESPKYLDHSNYLFITSKNLNDNSIDFSNARYISQEDYSLYIKRSNCAVGDIIFPLIGTIGKNIVLITDEHVNYQFAVKNVAIIKSINKKVNNKFLFYWLKSDCFYKQIRESERSGVVGFLGLSMLRNLKIKIPDLLTQNKIVSFLDDNCSKIDNEVALLQKKSILLDEYKNALIYETVTKGLDKNAEMKDSGIEWMGCVPIHWNIRRVKNILTNLNKSSFASGDADDGEYNFYVSGKKIKKISKFNLDKTAILLPTGGTFITHFNDNERCSYSTDVLALLLKNKNCNLKFYYYLFSSSESFFNEELFYGSGLKHLNRKGLFSTIVPVPLLKEQNNIVNYLDIETKKIEKEIELINKKVELLKEYKQSLIYEAVTGQLEIE